MNLKKLKEDLLDFGKVTILQEEYNLTILIKGEDLSKVSTVVEIFKRITRITYDEYPLIKISKTDETTFLLILKQNISNLNSNK